MLTSYVGKAQAHERGDISGGGLAWHRARGLLIITRPPTLDRMVSMKCIVKFQRAFIPSVVISLLLSLPRLAMATWSITAVNPKTREVGIAGASCTDFVFGIAGIAPVMALSLRKR